MRLVYGQDAGVAAWVADRLSYMSSGADFGPCVAVGVVSADGRPLAGVVWNHHLAAFGNIEGHFASDSHRWLTRNLIREIMNYPFVQLNCIRVTGITPRRATSARQFLETFGFKREGLVRRGFGDDDAVISGLLKREWLRSKWNAPAKPREAARGEVPADTAAAAGPERGGRRADGLEPADGALSVATQ